MTPSIPAPDIRYNIATWAIPGHAVPSVARQMFGTMQSEPFDPMFQGQKLETTYFDTANMDLRKARLAKDKYLTLRVRCYNQPGMPDTYALSAKTESEKFRVPLDTAIAEKFLSAGINDPADLGDILDTGLLARLMDVSDNQPLLPIVKATFHRYAVEDPNSRLTLDIHIETDTGKCFPTNVLELKSTDESLVSLFPPPLRRIKLSKFLWATSPR